MVLPRLDTDQTSGSCGVLDYASFAGPINEIVDMHDKSMRIFEGTVLIVIEFPTSGFWDLAL